MRNENPELALRVDNSSRESKPDATKSKLSPHETSGLADREPIVVEPPSALSSYSSEPSEASWPESNSTGNPDTHESETSFPTPTQTSVGPPIATQSADGDGREAATQNATSSVIPLLLIGGGLLGFVAIALGIVLYTMSNDDQAIASRQSETKLGVVEQRKVSESVESRTDDTDLDSGSDAHSSHEASIPTAKPTSDELKEREKTSSDSKAHSEALSGIADTQLEEAVKNEKPVDPPGVQKPRNTKDVIDYIKRSTVFIQVATSRGSQTGSGFLIRKSGPQGQIVTNAHVITPELGTLRSIQCVFNSGTRAEFSLQARTVLKEPTTDLAILEVTSERLPEPLDMSATPEVQETSDVIAAGFPFGEVLKTSKRSPSITLTKGTISSIRRDDFDNVLLLQIDGGINPGNSGGPVLTKDGGLVGVAVAKVQGTNIGFAIPMRTLKDTLRGDLAKVDIIKGDSAGRHFSFRVAVTDPNENIKRLKVIIFGSDDQIRERPEIDGDWRQASANLLFSKESLVGRSSTLLTAALPRPVKDLKFQIAISYKDGTTRWSPPKDIPANVGAAARPVRMARNKPKAIPGGHDDLVLLEKAMSDFALNSDRGDIACVDPHDHRAYLIPADELVTGSRPIDTPKVSVGSTPVSIFYKRYLGLRYYAVVCSQDAHLYLISADDFKLVKKIPIAGVGTSLVTASQNDRDPFIYYAHGSGHDSEAGVVDLRTMADCGRAFDDAMDFAISADGRYAYRRGPWSPSGFESLKRMNSLSDAKPTFVELHRDHRSTPAYVPDPHGNVTASGSGIYSVGLQKQLATLDFVAECFFKSRPLCVGRQYDRFRRQAQPKLFAASCNTFKSVGHPINLPDIELDPNEIALPRGVRGQADFKRVGMKSRLLADDLNERVVYASGNKIALIPLDKLGVPKEASLNLVLKSAEAVVGQKKKFNLLPADSDIDFEITDLPSGAELTLRGFAWSPQDKHVGKNTIRLNLSSDGVERNVNFDVTVFRPNIKLPFEFDDFIVQGKDQRFICWQIASSTKFGGGQGTTNRSRLCVGSILSKDDPVVSDLNFTIRQGVAVGDRLFLLPATDRSQARVYNIKTMKQEKVILSTTPRINRMEVNNNEVYLIGSESTDVFSAATLKLARTEDREDSALQQSITFLDGRMSNGVLFDSKSNKRLLIVSPGKVTALGKPIVGLYKGSFLRSGRQKLRTTHGFGSFSSRSRRSGTEITAGPVDLPNTDISASVESKTTLTRGNEAVQQVTLILQDNSGALKQRLPLVVDATRAFPFYDRKPRLQVADGRIFVSHNDRIYYWSPPNSEQNKPASQAKPSKLHFLPKQSVFTVTENTTILEHRLVGGKAPYETYLISRLSGIEFDDQTGRITIRKEQLNEVVIARLRSLTPRAINRNEFVQAVKNRSFNAIRDFQQRTGRKPNGYPIALRIHLKASDADANVAETQYFIMLDYSYDELRALYE